MNSKAGVKGYFATFSLTVFAQYANFNEKQTVDRATAASRKNMNE